MITQSINLNLITGQVLPRVNASQYDNNSRTLTMYLYDGELIFNITSGVSGYIQGTKPDRTGFQYLATVTAGSNVVTFDITEQMTAVAGDVTCELVLVDGDDRIATVNFILHVEPAALSDDTVISETDLPLIEEAVELVQHIDGYIAQMDEDAAKSEAFGAGTVNGVPVTSDNPAYHNNAKYYSEEAAASASGVEQFKEDSEAYAVGTRDGVPVASGDAAYRNNAKFYANAASGSAATAVASDIAAAQSKEDAEAWAVGERDSAPVTSGDATYHNNSKYYAGEAADSATAASTSETNAGLSESAAAQSEEDAEAWAVGTRNGVAVPSTDPTYHNNAKYYADEAGGTVNDMQGATSSADGVHGLVPQPLAGDQDKYLKGDGTWDDLLYNNPNLLDNPWFTVNQRGFTTDTTNTRIYTVDRWYIDNSKATFSNGIIEIELGSGGGSVRPRFSQITEHSIKAGQRYTLTAIAKVNVESGNYAPNLALTKSDGSYDTSKYGYLQLHETGNNYETFSYSFAPTEDVNNLGVAIIPSVTTAVKQSTVSIKAIKLELGSVSTLAMDTAPNYQQELAKCQRYFYKTMIATKSDSQTTSKLSVATNTNFLTGVDFPVQMRDQPVYSNVKAQDFFGTVLIDNIVFETSTKDGVCRFYKQNAFTQGTWYYMQFEASADL